MSGMSTVTTDGATALDKAFDVLDAIGTSARGLSQAELSARLALPRTTLYRLLATLVAHGMVRRDPQRRVYCLGFRCFEYARAAYAMPDLVAAAGLELRALRDLTGETTYLAVLDGHEVLSLERCDGAHSVRSSSAPGQRKPVHCTSQGKAILSALPAAQRDALVKDLALNPQTPRSITDRRRLQAELKLTATRGYSIDDEEMILGVRCVGAPIIDGEGRVRGAISVAGPAFRLTRQRIDLLGPEIQQAARRIGQQLDATRPHPSDHEAEIIDGERAFHGAHPRWFARQGALLWADTLAAVHRTTQGEDRTIAAVEAPIEALLLHRQGALIAQAEGWSLVDGEGRKTPQKILPRLRFTALTVRGDGTLWACVSDCSRFRIGQVAAARDSRGAPDLEWHLDEAVTALAWDAGGRTLYAATVESGNLYAMGEGVRGLRRLATVPKGSGRVGGLAIDVQGGVWCALADGWSVVRFAPDGSLDRVVALPVPCPTDLAFGGADGTTLFVTSARDLLSMEALTNAPQSGALLAIHTGIAGAPAAELDWTLD
jgi:DNA-binding IclR family transcriptional regulator/sugar lactone lactonase YvrE